MPAPLPIRNLSHVSIEVTDLERSKAFYRDVFGWEQEFETEVDGAALGDLVGSGGKGGRAAGGRIANLRLELMDMSFNPKTPVSMGLGLRVLSLEVADIQEAFARAQEMGLRTMSAPVELHGTRMFFLQDPDGQGIEVVEYVPGGGAGWKEVR